MAVFLPGIGRVDSLFNLWVCVCMCACLHVSCVCYVCSTCWLVCAIPNDSMPSHKKSSESHVYVHNMYNIR